MTASQLRDELIEQLWKVNKMDIILHLREFTEGELATLWFLRDKKEGTNPSLISDYMRLSRARMANILGSLRQKNYVDMEISSDDRRKMTVKLTPEGEKYLSEKYKFLLDYFDLYVEKLGEKYISDLVSSLKKMLKNEQFLRMDS